MNYSELSQALQDYLETTETTFVTNIPVFVRQAEERINREVVIPDLRKETSGTTFTASDPELSKPADYLATLIMAVNDGSNDIALLKKDQSFIREAYPSSATTGVPEYYADKNSSTWLVAPTPASNYAVTVTYLYDPESIVTASTSWLGDNAESALLYACLVEAYTFLKGDADLIAQYDKMYKEALGHLDKLGRLIIRDEYR